MPRPWHTVECQALWGQFPIGEFHLCGLWGRLHQDTRGWHHHVSPGGRQGDVEWPHSQMWRYCHRVTNNWMKIGRERKKQSRLKKSVWCGTSKLCYIYLVIFFSGICVTQALSWLTFISFQCFLCGYKTILRSSALFNLYLYPLHPSHHSSTSLLLQLLVGATTRGHLVSSSLRGGQATTKTPWVVSGLLRLSQEAPSRSALTGLYDSHAAIQWWKQLYICILLDSKTHPVPFVVMST